MKSIVITDDSVVNSHGFRVLTDGGDLSQYKRNPVLLYDHVRRNGENEKEIILPIGKMLDIQRVGTQYIAKPEFDLEDDFAAAIARKYDKDILNMASIGFEPIEWSDDPAMKLEGQRFPTITKWILHEVSITDIGANPNCCKVLHQGKMITLSQSSKQEDIRQFFESNKQALKKFSLLDEFNQRAENGTLMTLKESNIEHFNKVYQAGTGKRFKDDNRLSRPVNTHLKAEFIERAEMGTLMDLKEVNPDHFKDVYLSGTGKEYKD